MNLANFKIENPDAYRGLAEKLSVSQSYISMIKGGVRIAPPEMALDIFKETGGKVTLESLRPSLAMRIKELIEMGLL